MSGFSRFTRPVSCRDRGTRPGETLFVCDGFLPLLARLGLSDFEAVWSFDGGDLVKRRGGRTVVRLRGGDDDGPASTLYLKRHRQQLGWRERFRRLLQGAAWAPEGVRELRFYGRFRENGLATAEPVAAGSMRRSSSRVDSFSITRDYAPLISLESLLLMNPERLRGRARQVKREALLLAVARYAARMHASGMNHMDFNATHILLDDPDAAAPRLALFDLQRVDTARANRLRWPIKSLAEVCVTLPGDIFSPSDRRFLLRAYRDARAVCLPEGLLYRLVIGKAARIAAHTRKRGLAPKLTGSRGDDRRPRK